MSDERRATEEAVRRCYSTWSTTYHDEYYGEGAAHPPVHRDLLLRLLDPDAGVVRIDGVDVAPDKGDAIVDLDDSFVFPGLINAHDHLELNSQPRLKWRERYDNASEWFADFQPRFDTDPALAVTRPATLEDRVWIGGLKNLLSGVTTVCHHNPIHRPLRRRFPVRVVTKFGYSHSLHIDGDAVSASHRQTPRDWPWLIHAAEGLDHAAQAELETLDRLGCLSANSVFIHGVAFCRASADRVQAFYVAEAGLSSAIAALDFEAPQAQFGSDVDPIDDLHHPVLQVATIRAPRWVETYGSKPASVTTSVSSDREKPRASEVTPSARRALRPCSAASPASASTHSWPPSQRPGKLRSR